MVLSQSHHPIFDIHQEKKNTHQNVLYDPRWSKWYRNGALALTNRGVILLKPQPNRSKLHGLKVWWSKLPTCENKGLDTARLKNLIFHLTNRYIYECMWFYECRVHLKKPSWTCSMVFWLSIQGELSIEFLSYGFLAVGCSFVMWFFPSRGLGNMRKIMPNLPQIPRRKRNLILAWRPWGTHNFQEHNPGQPCYFRVDFWIVVQFVSHLIRLHKKISASSDIVISKWCEIWKVSFLGKEKHIPITSSHYFPAASTFCLRVPPKALGCKNNSSRPRHVRRLSLCTDAPGLL